MCVCAPPIHIKRIMYTHTISLGVCYLITPSGGRGALTPPPRRRREHNRAMHVIKICGWFEDVSGSATVNYF